MKCFLGDVRCFLGAECVFWRLSVFSGGCSNAGGTLSAPRNCKSLYVVGPEVWRFDLPAPRNWKSLNVVGPEIWTINLSAPRELRIFNLVGENFGTGEKMGPTRIKNL